MVKKHKFPKGWIQIVWKDKVGRQFTANVPSVQKWFVEAVIDKQGGKVVRVVK